MKRYLVENLFGIEGLNIAWYGLIIVFGMFLGGALAVYRSKKTGIGKEYIYGFAIAALPICIICARIYYVIFEWNSYKDDPINIIFINNGGLAIYGGVIGGVITAVVYCGIKKVSFLSFADTLIPSLVLGQSIGRWGNFINQEAYGEIITNPKLQFFPYGVYIENVGEWHQAAFFYESALNAVLLALMLIFYGKFRRKGCLLPFYMIGYGAIRFFVEGMRTDSLYLMPGLRISQILSVILVFGVIVGSYLICRFQKSTREHNDEKIQ